MRKHTIRIATASVFIFVAANDSHARNDQKSYPVSQALAGAEAREKVDPAIHLFFGTQSHGPISESLGEWGTNKKSNGFARSDQDACERAFLSAVLSLQERARKLGGNAVIDIKSNYKNKIVSSESEYVCGSGALMSGVAFTGKVVKMGGASKRK